MDTKLVQLVRGIRVGAAAAIALVAAGWWEDSTALRAGGMALFGLVLAGGVVWLVRGTGDGSDTAPADEAYEAD